MSVRNRLQRLLLAGELEQVLRSLTVLADQLGDNKLMNEAVHINERYRHLHHSFSEGLVDASVYERELEQVRQSLHFVIGQLP